MNLVPVLAGTLPPVQSSTPNSNTTAYNNALHEQQQHHAMLSHAKSYDEINAYDKYLSKVFKKNSSPAVLNAMYQNSASSSPLNHNSNQTLRGTTGTDKSESTTTPLLSNEYTDLISNGLHIKKLKNDYYSGSSDSPNTNKLKRKSLEESCIRHASSPLAVSLTPFQTSRSSQINEYGSNAVSPLSVRSVSPSSTLSSSSSPLSSSFSLKHQLMLNQSSSSKKTKLAKVKSHHLANIYDMAEVNNYYRSSAESPQSKKASLMHYYHFAGGENGRVELGEVVENDVELGEVTIDKIKNPAIITTANTDAAETRLNG